MRRKRTRCVLMMIAAALATTLAGCSGGAAKQTSAPTTGTATETPSTGVLEGRLLFSRFFEATHTFTGMFICRPDGSAETTVPLPGPEGGGRWSRSGKEIAVMTVLADGRVSTAIIAPDGTVLRVLEIPDATLNLGPGPWSPDDARIACDGWDDADPSRKGIYTIRSSDGGDLQRLTTAPVGGTDEPGDYSPDGQIVFMRAAGDEGPGPLMLIDAKGGQPRSLIKAPMEDAGRFSPDGRSVLSSSDWHIEVIDLDGKVLSRFTVEGSHLFGPAWSPDGTRIAFSMGKGGPFAEIYTSLPDGTDRRQVTHTAENEIAVDWGP